VPAARVRLLDAASAGGDLSAFGFSDLRWIHTPGHTPGHISLLHTPSRTLLAVDALSLVKPALGASKAADARDREVRAPCCAARPRAVRLKRRACPIPMEKGA
jgi:hypothetical protein